MRTSVIRTIIFCWMQIRAAVLVTLASCMISAAVRAGPAEDYAEGERAFRDGDVVAAMVRFRSAAAAGDLQAQVRLADMLDYAEENAEAIEWYRKAADLGSAAASYGLARMLSAGEGVAADPAAAAKWFTVAAEQSHQGAIWVLVSAYENGELGLHPDPAQALTWLHRAADAPGGEWAVTRLARAYRNGELGLTTDPQEAARWESRLPKHKSDD